MSSTRIWVPTAATVDTSACVPSSAVWQPSQNPQPGAPPRARSGLTHWRAAANARAAVSGHFGGPVNSQACVIFDAAGGGVFAVAAVTRASASRAAAPSSVITRS